MFLSCLNSLLTTLSLRDVALLKLKRGFAGTNCPNDGSSRIICQLFVYNSFDFLLLVGILSNDSYNISIIFWFLGI